MGCCGSNDDDVVLIDNKKRKSKCFQGFLCGLGTLVMVVVVTVLVIYVFKSKSDWDSGCNMEFEFLQDFKENYGDFVSTYFIDRCSKERPKLDPMHAPIFSNLPSPPLASESQCSGIPDVQKFDCFPRGNYTKEKCLKRGCCFVQKQDPTVPMCFYPQNFNSYLLTSKKENQYGLEVNYRANFSSPYPDDAHNFTLEIKYLSATQFSIHIVRGDKKKKEDPLLPELSRLAKPIDDKDRQFRVEVDKIGFGLRVIRSSSNTTLFSTSGGLIVSGQVLQVSLLTQDVVFGIGERKGSIRLDTSSWSTVTLFNHDTAPTSNMNGYGTLPFYLALEEGGLSHGVSFLNYHAMDIYVQPAPALTFRSIGGSIGFLITLGNNPVEVVAKNTAKISPHPQLPPYWALGFHLSRFGYKNTSDMIEVFNRTKAAGIPFDTQWADIDYMSKRNDFTVDPVNFKDLSDFVNHLHDMKMKFIPILDPGVSGSEASGTYPAYDSGLQYHIFIMDGKAPFRGWVWNPSSTVFVDFSHPKSLQYWVTLLKDLHEQLPFDGIWIDMNEPSNFRHDGTQCPNNSLNIPPYVPEVAGERLSFQTVCMSAQHFSSYHYDIHNVYAMLEAVVTSLGVVESTNGERPFVVTRASFLSSSTYAAHWTGDVFSTWEDFAQSIRDIQSQALFGQGMIGADICGFNGNTTASLCARWTSAGAFYPFSRNHNSDQCIDQDPVALGPDVVNAAKVSLSMRYSILPYLYTLLHQHHTSHLPVIRSMFMEFPKDNQTYIIEDQFMWGSALLFAPILTESENSRNVYLGVGQWIDWHSGHLTEVSGKRGHFFKVSAPSGAVPAFLRGGHIVPMQHPANTTAESRQNNFMLRVALNKQGKASGLLYWDDGHSLKMYKEYNMISFSATNHSVTTNADVLNLSNEMLLDSVRVAPLPPVHNVTVNCKGTIIDSSFNYDPQIKELSVYDFAALMNSPMNISWSL